MKSFYARYARENIYFVLQPKEIALIPISAALIGDYLY